MKGRIGELHKGVDKAKVNTMLINGLWKVASWVKLLDPFYLFILHLKVIARHMLGKSGSWNGRPSMLEWLGGL